jgi:hypothetical protein
MKTVFLRVLEAEDKAGALLAAIRNEEPTEGKTRFELDSESLRQIPSSPFAYWLPVGVKELFAQHERFATQKRFACNGASTCDDFRYTRLWAESHEGAENTRWRYVPYNTGSKFARFSKQIPLVVPWDKDRATFWGFVGRPGRWQTNPVGAENYFRAGITWPLRGIVLSAQALPTGCAFSVGGKVAVAEPADLPWLLGLLNSAIIDQLVRVFAGKVGGVQYESGLIERIPVPELSVADKRMLARFASRAWLLKRSLDTSNETCHSFTLPALVQVAGADLAMRTATWSEHVRTVEAELVSIQAEIDQRCFALYGIDGADRRAITEGFSTRGSESETASSDGANDVDEDDAGGDIEENEFAADAAGLAAELVSWAVGVAFGRFDVRLATGGRPMPTEPEPFDPLPACSSGMLTGEDGLPLAQPPARYPLGFPEAGVLVDDLGHAQDLPTAVRAVFDLVFGADADRWWNDVAALLDRRGHDLRVWLAGSFFEHHLGRHSKSRRKAPILWQLGTPSGRYSVWLYAHRLTRDSFFLLQNEMVGPKLAHAEQQLTSLMQSAGGNPSASERKEIATQEALVEELRAMLEEVKRVAPLWNPNLDDGVVLTMAPLWRLVPQCKPWQRELKAKWDELSPGKYDWAHLAMHLWPERVVPKCGADRSIAIVHGLEGEFWIEAEGGKWKSRTTPRKSVGELVRERSSPAVKAALKSMLDAPTASGNGRARGRRAATPPATEGGSR